MKQGWELKEFEDCLDKVVYTEKIQRKDFLEDGEFPVISQEQNFINGYWNDSDAVFKIKKPVVIFGDHTQVLKYVDFDFVLGADGVKILQPIDGIKAKYLFYYLNSVNLKSLGYARHYRLLKEIQVPIPPIPEQQRIVSVLDEAFASIAQAKANAERNLVNARELFESVLGMAFDKNWEEKRLDEICEVKDGTHDTPQYIEDGIPFVTQKNIREDGLSFSETKFIALSDHEKYYKRSNVSFGDILISMIGANRGMACIVDDERVISIKNVGLIKSSKNINQAYLLYFLKSPKAKKYVSAASKGGAQEFVGLTELRKFPILLAPLTEQRAIVARLKALSAETGRLEAVYRQKIAALEELKKSVLAKAFEGSL